jgi:D-tyrosyl-tRNA(Tyr) deacylase
MIGLSYRLQLMRVLLQRVRHARVTVDDQVAGEIESGLLLFLGISKPDSPREADYLLDKVLGLRVFPDADSKMNLNVQQAGGSLLVVSQFTLYADCSRGRRPSFDRAAPPQQAEALYNYFLESARRGPVPVQAGIFQAMMQVYILNDGPVTILLDSAERNQK